jgi:hypothetical protein
MSMFGLGRPQPSSAEKIAAAEQEMDLITDMFNKYDSPFPSFPSHNSILPSQAKEPRLTFVLMKTDSNKPA